MHFKFLIEKKDSEFVSAFLRTLPDRSFYVFFKQVSSTDASEKNRPVAEK